MATIYICKCGRQVRKNTSADNTGNRDTTGCRGCPYLLPWGPTEWTGKSFEQNVQGYECRMSPEISYATDYSGSANDKRTMAIHSLDLDFLEEVQAWIDEYADGQLSGRFSRDTIRGTDYCNKGRYSWSISCAQNKKGMAAKAALIERFFGPDGHRLDKTPEEEKAIVLAAIEAGKAQAQKKEDKTLMYKDPVTGWLYRVGPNPINDKGVYELEYLDQQNSTIWKPDVYWNTNAVHRDRDHLQEALDNRARRDGWESVEKVPVENPTNAAEDAQQCALTASDAPTLPSPSANADAQQGVGDNPANPTHAAPVSPVDAGAATQSPSDAAPASLEVESELDVAMKGHSSEEYQECGISSDKCRCKECLREGCRDYPGTAYCVIGNNVCPGRVMKETSIPGADGSTAFDYSGLDDQTVADLHLAEREYSSGKKMAEMGLRRMADAVAIAHDALCGSCDKLSQLKHGNRGENAFGTWCESIGIHRKAAERLLQVAKLMDSSTPREEKVLEELSPSLLYAAAKPSAPAELVQAVKDGDITTHKQFKELEAQLKAEREAREKAEREAEDFKKRSEDAHKAANTYHCQYEEANAQKSALLDKQGAYICQVTAAEHRAEEAERRARAAEEDAAEKDKRIRELETGRPQTIEATVVERIRMPEMAEEDAAELTTNLAASVTTVQRSFFMAAAAMAPQVKTRCANTLWDTVNELATLLAASANPSYEEEEATPFD